MIQFNDQIKKEIYHTRVEKRNNSNNLVTITLDIEDDYYNIIQTEAKKFDLTDEEMAYNGLFDGVLLMIAKENHIKNLFDDVTMSVVEKYNFVLDEEYYVVDNNLNIIGLDSLKKINHE